MERRDLASNLEFWSGRARNGGAGEDPQRRRPSPRRRLLHGPAFLRPSSLRPSSLRPSSLRGAERGTRARRAGSRPVAAGALLAGLTAAWLVAGHRSHAPASAAAAAGVVAPPSAPPSTLPTTTTVPVSRTCGGLSSARREVRCVIDGVDLDVRVFGSGSVAGAYRRAAGVTATAARSGLPACARGVPDERAWSTAASPDAAVGRYRCRFEGGRAAMWWTRGDRLVHAVASDGDLAGLFSWWRAHPSE
jgi:hypothetical protein